MKLYIRLSLIRCLSLLEFKLGIENFIFTVMIVTIMIVKFVNRKWELATLKNLYQSGKPQLVIVYGRRRTGKTRLLLEFLTEFKGLYFYTPRGGSETVLNEFSGVVEDRFFPGFRFRDFKTFLEYIFQRLSIGEIIVLDEFQRLTEIDGSISLIQKYWDEKCSSHKSMLILSGSSIGIIRRLALRGDAPLHGRRTFTIEVKPLKFIDLKEWFPKLSSEDLVKIYGAFGGTPAYLEKIDEKISVEENIIRLILSRGGALYDEPEHLLMEELKVPNRYMDILTAISLGKNTLSEIADFTKINRENLTTYLETLKSMKIISRELPVLAKTRRSQYVILDPFFEFWFRFVRPNKTALEAGLERKVWINIREEFNTYLGKIFQKIAEEYVIDEVKSGNIDLEADIIGRWWSRNEEIDIIAYSSKRREGILFEVKWKELSYNDVKKIILELIGKSRLIPEIKEKRYGVIAKRIVDKEKLVEEGCIVKDLNDIVAANPQHNGLPP